jgi:hypothetical protein
MSAVFADTFYFLALLNDKDQSHIRAVEVATVLQGKLVTTAWVLTELGLPNFISELAMKHVTNAMLAEAINAVIAEGTTAKKAEPELFDTHAVERWVLRHHAAAVARQILEHEDNDDVLQQFSASFSTHIGKAFGGQVEPIQKVSSPNLAGRSCDNQQWRRIVPIVLP